MMKSQKCHFPKGFAHHAARHLRIPVESAKQRRDNRADQHIVEVSHHKVRCAQLPVNGAAESMMPVNPATRN